MHAHRLSFTLIRNIKGRRAPHRRAATNYHKNNYKGKKKKIRIRECCSATLKNRAELFVFTVLNLYFSSSFNCFDVFRDQYIYVYFSHSEYELNLLVVE